MDPVKVVEGVKEVSMDVPHEGTRKRRAGVRKARRTRGAVEEAATVVTKDPAVPQSQHQKPTHQAKPAAGPMIILAPPKKKPVKVMLVPKAKSPLRQAVRKTFRAKKVSLTIDNTTKTQKQHKEIMTKVDELTDDQVRAAVVRARLSRRETVGKAPMPLLRQMVKDYQIMRGMLL